MKLAKSQLKRIIKEEISEISDTLKEGASQRVYVLFNSTFSKKGPLSDGSVAPMFEGVFSSADLAVEGALALTYGISLDKSFEIWKVPVDDPDGRTTVVKKFKQSDLDQKRFPHGPKKGTNR